MRNNAWNVKISWIKKKRVRSFFSILLQLIIQYFIISDYPQTLSLVKLDKKKKIIKEKNQRRKKRESVVKIIRNKG